MRRLMVISILLLAAGLASAQTLQQDLQKISASFDALPQLYRYPPHAQGVIAMLRMNIRSREEAEVRARYAKGKERRRFQKAQKAAERAEQECMRALRIDCPPHTDACYPTPPDLAFEQFEREHAK
jgi:hypothetical protein